VDLTHLKFDENGLIPVVVQDWRDGSVLMLAYMNAEAVQRTLETRSVHFWSRSRSRLWEKGETSGHKLVLKDLFVDCDGDALLVQAEPLGPACHTNERTCFFVCLDADGQEGRYKVTGACSGGILDRLYRVIQDRKANPSEGSYTAKLLAGGVDRVLKKVVEEAGEVVLAAKGGNKEELVYEMADLLFHGLVALALYAITPDEVYKELARRFGTSGLRAHASREDSREESQGGSVTIPNRGTTGRGQDT
jgi:phosphoribosyl-ATP pyrophosphohydrolase/phosphoribosyl-AMP cyclohydrolase